MPSFLIWRKLQGKIILSFDFKRKKLQSNNDIFKVLGSSLVFVSMEQLVIQIIQVMVNFSQLSVIVELL